MARSPRATAEKPPRRIRRLPHSNRGRHRTRTGLRHRNKGPKGGATLLIELSGRSPIDVSPESLGSGLFAPLSLWGDRSLLSITARPRQGNLSSPGPFQGDADGQEGANREREAYPLAAFRILSSRWAHTCSVR